MGYYVNVEPDVNLYVEDLNPKGKKTIVFLHGWPGSHDLFEYQFTDLAYKGYRCVGIDQRGFGKSDRPLTGYGYDRPSDDVRAVIEALELNDVTLLGHSNGGAIACRYMTRHHGYGVEKLVLCAAVPTIVRRPDFPYGMSKEELESLIQVTLTNRPKRLLDFGNDFFFQNVGSGILDWFFQIGIQAAGWATAAVEQNWIDDNNFADLPQINVPTLILHGIHDAVVNYTIAEIQKRMIRNSILVPFESSGHALFFEERDKFNNVLMQFIEG